MPDETLPLIPMTHSEEPEKKPETQPNTFAIGSSTPIALGVIMALVGGIAAGAWQMSAFSAKLDNIAVLLTSNVSTVSSLERRVSEHERDDSKTWTETKTDLAALRNEVLNLRNSGSLKIPEIERQLAELKIRFDLHYKDSKP